MYKPKSLRAHLKAAIADLTQNPDKLLIFADAGNTVATGTKSLSFEYRYQLNIIVTDYRGEPDAIMVALLAWVGVHQRDLLEHPELRKTGIGFDVDFNNHETVDLSIKLALTERVVVDQAGAGRLEVRHPGEPQMTPAYADAFWQAYAGDSLLAEWHTPADPT
ncbi:phage tail protein [Collimonas pratensis]|uniref:P2 phage tail completion R family protein n=1 Tax=Collimonas pratensis TaxID=279113 RepID=A0ABN4M563_9BURK|nr:phage tail protein [Collimonas pratensis]AMP13383.1 P2 phage tail completion R family protein [Collimonas pratensis]